jgi:hypothetical protein
LACLTAVRVLRNNFLVKQFRKITFACALFAVTLAANLDAQSPAQTPAAQPAVGEAAVQTSPPGALEAEVLPSGSPPALFYIGPSPDKNVPSIFSGWWPAAIALPISNSIVCSWIIALIIIVVVRATTWKNIKEIPSGMQNVIEMIVESWNNFMKDVLDERVSRWVFPYATTFLIFILLCNYVDLVPGVFPSAHD